MMSTIQYKVEAILDLSLEELAMLKMVIEEHREKQDPFGEHFEINTSAAKEK
jgi:hypothetical protein